MRRKHALFFILLMYCSMLVAVSFEPKVDPEFGLPSSDTLTTASTTIEELAQDFQRWEEMSLDFGGGQSFLLENYPTNQVWDGFTQFYNAQNTTLNITDIRAISKDTNYEGSELESYANESVTTYEGTLEQTIESVSAFTDGTTGTTVLYEDFEQYLSTGEWESDHGAIWNDVRVGYGCSLSVTTSVNHIYHGSRALLVNDANTSDNIVLAKTGMDIPDTRYAIFTIATYWGGQPTFNISIGDSNEGASIALRFLPTGRIEYYNYTFDQWEFFLIAGKYKYQLVIDRAQGTYSVYLDQAGRGDSTMIQGGIPYNTTESLGNLFLGTVIEETTSTFAIDFISYVCTDTLSLSSSVIYAEDFEGSRVHSISLDEGTGNVWTDNKETSVYHYTNVSHQIFDISLAGHYNGSDTFRTPTEGQDKWTGVYSRDSYLDHAKVGFVQASICQRSLTISGSGQLEFWIVFGSDTFDVTVFLKNSGGQSATSMKFSSAAGISYYDDSLSTYVPLYEDVERDRWYHIRIDWAGRTLIAPGVYSIYIDTIQRTSNIQMSSYVSNQLIDQLEIYRASGSDIYIDSVDSNRIDYWGYYTYRSREIASDILYHTDLTLDSGDNEWMYGIRGSNDLVFNASLGIDKPGYGLAFTLEWMQSISPFDTQTQFFNWTTVNGEFFINKTFTASDWDAFEAVDETYYLSQIIFDFYGADDNVRVAIDYLRLVDHRADYPQWTGGTVVTTSDYQQACQILGEVLLDITPEWVFDGAKWRNDISAYTYDIGTYIASGAQWTTLFEGMSTISQFRIGVKPSSRLYVTTPTGEIELNESAAFDQWVPFSVFWSYETMKWGFAYNGIRYELPEFVLTPYYDQYTDESFYFDRIYTIRMATASTLFVDNVKITGLYDIAPPEQLIDTEKAYIVDERYTGYDLLFYDDFEYIEHDTSYNEWQTLIASADLTDLRSYWGDRGAEIGVPILSGVPESNAHSTYRAEGGTTGGDIEDIKNDDSSYFYLYEVSGSEPSCVLYLTFTLPSADVANLYVDYEFDDWYYPDTLITAGTLQIKNYATQTWETVRTFPNVEILDEMTAAIDNSDQEYVNATNNVEIRFLQSIRQSGNYLSNYHYYFVNLVAEYFRPNILKLEGASPVAAERYFEPTDEVRTSFWMIPEQTNAFINCTLVGFYGRQVLTVGFGDDGNLFYFANGVHTVGSAYTADKWYYFEIELRHDGQHTFSVAVNQTALTIETALTIYDTPTAINFTVDATGAAVYIDDVTVLRHAGGTTTTSENAVLYTEDFEAFNEGFNKIENTWLVTNQNEPTTDVSVNTSYSISGQKALHLNDTTATAGLPLARSPSWTAITDGFHYVTFYARFGQTNAEFYTDMIWQGGGIATRIRFRTDGYIECADGGSSIVTTTAYQANKWHYVELFINGDQDLYSMRLDNAWVFTEAAFLTSGTAAITNIQFWGQTMGAGDNYLFVDDVRVLGEASAFSVYEDYIGSALVHDNTTIAFDYMLGFDATEVRLYPTFTDYPLTGNPEDKAIMLNDSSDSDTASLEYNFAPQYSAVRASFELNAWQTTGRLDIRVGNEAGWAANVSMGREDNKWYIESPDPNLLVDLTTDPYSYTTADYLAFSSYSVDTWYKVDLLLITEFGSDYPDNGLIMFINDRIAAAADIDDSASVTDFSKILFTTNDTIATDMKYLVRNFQLTLGGVASLPDLGQLRATPDDWRVAFPSTSTNRYITNATAMDIEDGVYFTAGASGMTVESEVTLAAYLTLPPDVLQGDYTVSVRVVYRPLYATKMIGYGDDTTWIRLRTPTGGLEFIPTTNSTNTSRQVAYREFDIGEFAKFVDDDGKVTIEMSAGYTFETTGVSEIQIDVIECAVQYDLAAVDRLAYFISPTIDLEQPYRVNELITHWDRDALPAAHFQLELSNDTVQWRRYESFQKLSITPTVARYYRFITTFPTQGGYSLPNSYLGLASESYAFEDIIFDRYFNHTQSYFDVTYTGESTETRIQEGFDAYTEFPDYWNIYEQSGTELTLDDSQSVSASQSVRLYDASISGYCGLGSAFDPIDTYAYVGFYGRASQANGFFAAYIANSTGHPMAALVFGREDNGWWVGEDNSWSDTEYNYAADTWYKVEIYINLAERFYYVLIDGTLIIKDADFYMPDSDMGSALQSVSSIAFYTHTSEGVEPYEYFLDSLIVRKLLVSDETRRSTINYVASEFLTSLSFPEIDYRARISVFWWANSTWVDIPSKWTFDDVLSFFPMVRYDGLVRWRLRVEECLSPFHANLTVVRQYQHLNFVKFRWGFESSDIISYDLLWEDDFEVYDGATVTLADNYSLYETGGSVAIDTAEYYSGVQSAKLDDTSASDYAGMTLWNIDVYGTLSFSTWVKITSGFGAAISLYSELGAYFGIQFQPDSSIEVSDGSSFTTTELTWGTSWMLVEISMNMLADEGVLTVDGASSTHAIKWNGVQRDHIVAATAYTWISQTGSLWLDDFTVGTVVSGETSFQAFPFMADQWQEDVGGTQYEPAEGHSMNDTASLQTRGVYYPYQIGNSYVTSPIIYRDYDDTGEFLPWVNDPEDSWSLFDDTQDYLLATIGSGFAVAYRPMTGTTDMYRDYAIHFRITAEFTTFSLRMYYTDDTYDTLTTSTEVHEETITGSFTPGKTFDALVMLGTGTGYGSSVRIYQEIYYARIQKTGNKDSVKANDGSPYTVWTYNVEAPPTIRTEINFDLSTLNGVDDLYLYYDISCTHTSSATGSIAFWNGATWDAQVSSIAGPKAGYIFIPASYLIGGNFKMRISSGYSLLTGYYYAQTNIDYLAVADNMLVWQDTDAASRSLHTEIRFNATPGWTGGVSEDYLAPSQFLYQSLRHIRFDWSLQWSKASTYSVESSASLWNYRTNEWDEVWRWSVVDEIGSPAMTWNGIYVTDIYLNDYYGKDYIESNGTVRFLFSTYPQMTYLNQSVDYAYIETGIRTGEAVNYVAYIPDLYSHTSASITIASADVYEPLDWDGSEAREIDGNPSWVWAASSSAAPEVQARFQFVIDVDPFVGIELYGFGFPDNYEEQYGVEQIGSWTTPGYVDAWNYETGDWDTLLTVSTLYAPYLFNYTIDLNITEGAQYVQANTRYVSIRVRAAGRTITSGIGSYQANIQLDAIRVLSDGGTKQPMSFKFFSGSENTAHTVIRTTNVSLNLFRAATSLSFRAHGYASAYEIYPGSYSAYFNVTAFSATGQFLGEWKTPSLFEEIEISLLGYANKIIYSIELIVETTSGAIVMDVFIDFFEFGVLVQPDEILLRINGIRPTPTGLGSGIITRRFEQRTLNITSNYPGRIDLGVSGEFLNTTTPPELFDSRTVHYYAVAPFPIENPELVVYNFSCLFAYLRSGTSGWQAVEFTEDGNDIYIATDQFDLVLASPGVLGQGEYIDVMLLTDRDIHALAMEPRDQVTPSVITGENVTYRQVMYATRLWQFYYFVEPHTINWLDLSRRSNTETIPIVYHYGDYYYFNSFDCSTAFPDNEIFDAEYNLNPGWDIDWEIVEQNNTFIQIDYAISVDYVVSDVWATIPLPAYQHWTIYAKEDLYIESYYERFNGHFDVGVVDGQEGWVGSSNITSELYHSFPYSLQIEEKTTHAIPLTANGRLEAATYIENTSYSHDIHMLSLIEDDGTWFEVLMNASTGRIYVNNSNSYTQTSLYANLQEWTPIAVQYNNTHVSVEYGEFQTAAFAASIAPSQIGFNSSGSYYVDTIRAFRVIYAGQNMTAEMQIAQSDDLTFFIDRVSEIPLSFTVHGYKVYYTVQLKAGQTTTFVQYQVDVWNSNPALFSNTTIRVNTSTDQYLIWKIIENLQQRNWEIDTSFAEYILITIPNFTTTHRTFFLSGYSWKYTQVKVSETTNYAHYRVKVETNDIDAVNEIGGGIIRVDILNVLDFTVWTVNGDFCTFSFNSSEDTYADHININLTNIETSPIYLEVEGYSFGFQSQFISQTALRIYYTNTLTLPTNNSMGNYTIIYTVIPNAVDYNYWVLSAPSRTGGGEVYLHNRTEWGFEVFADRVEITIPSIQDCIALGIITEFPDFITFKVIGYTYVIHEPTLVSSINTRLSYNVKIEVGHPQTIQPGTLIRVEITRDPRFSVVELYLNDVNVTAQFQFEVEDLNYVHWYLDEVNATETIFQVRLYTWHLRQLLDRDTDLLVEYSITISSGHPNVVNQTLMEVDIGVINPVPFRIWEIWYGDQNLTALFSLTAHVDRIELTIPNFTIPSRAYKLYGYGHDVAITLTQSIDLEEIYEVKVETLHNKSVVNETIQVDVQNIQEYQYWEVTFQNESIPFLQTATAIYFTIPNMSIGVRTYFVHGYSWREYTYVFNNIEKKVIYKTEITVLHDLNLTGIDREIGVNVEEYNSRIMWEVTLGGSIINISRFDATTIFFDLPELVNDTVGGLNPDYTFSITGYSYRVSQVLLTNNELLEQYRVTVEYDRELYNLSTPWNAITAFVTDKGSTLKWYWEVFAGSIQYNLTESPPDQVQWQIVNLTGTITTFTVSGYGARITPATATDDPNAFIEETGSLIVYRVTVEVLKIEALNCTLLGIDPRFIDVRFSSTNIAQFPTWRFYANDAEIAHIYNFSTFDEQQTELIAGFNFSMSSTIFDFNIPYVNATDTVFELIGYRSEIQLELTPLEDLQFEFEITITTEDLTTLETALRVTEDTRDEVDTKIGDVQNAIYWELWWNDTIVSDAFGLSMTTTYAEFHPKDLGLTAFQGQYSTTFYLYAYKLDYDYRFTYLNQTYMTYEVVIRTPSNMTINDPFRYQPAISVPQTINDPTLVSGNPLVLTAQGLRIRVEDAEHSFDQMTLWEFYRVDPQFTNYSSWASVGAEIATIYVPFLNFSGDITYELRGYKFFVTYTLLNNTEQIGDVQINIQSVRDFAAYPVEKELVFGENNQFNFTGLYRLYIVYFANESPLATLTSYALLELNQFSYSFPSKGTYYLRGYNWLVLSEILNRNGTYLNVEIQILSVYNFDNYSVAEPLVFDEIDVGDDYLLYNFHFPNSTMIEYNITIDRDSNEFSAVLPARGTYYLRGYNWLHSRTFMNVNNATYNVIDITIEALVEFGEYYWVQDPYAPNSNVSIAGYREYDLWAPNIRVLPVLSSQNITIFTGDTLLLVFNLTEDYAWYRLLLDNTSIHEQGRYYGQYLYWYANTTDSHLYALYGDGGYILSANVTVIDQWNFYVNTTTGYQTQANATYIDQSFSIQWELHGAGYYRVWRNDTLIVSSTAFTEGDLAAWTSFSEHQNAATYNYTLETDYGSGFGANSSVLVTIAAKPVWVLYRNATAFLRRVDNTFILDVPYRGTWSLRSYDWYVDKEMYVQREDYFRLDFAIVANHDFLLDPVYRFDQPLIFTLERLQGTVGYNISSYTTYKVYNGSHAVVEIAPAVGYLPVAVTDRFGNYSLRGFHWDYIWVITDYDIGVFIEIQLNISTEIAVGNIEFDLDLSSQLVLIDTWHFGFINGTTVPNTNVRRVGYHIRFNLTVSQTAAYRIRGFGTIATVPMGSVYFSNTTHFGAEVILNSLFETNDSTEIILDLSAYLTKQHEFWGIVIDGVKRTEISVTQIGNYIYHFAVPFVNASSTYEIYGFSSYWEIEFQSDLITQIHYVVNTFDGLVDSNRIINLTFAGGIDVPVWELYWRDNGTKYKDITDFSATYLSFTVTIPSYDPLSPFPQVRYTILGKDFSTQALVVADTGVYTKIEYTITTNFPLINTTIILDLPSIGITHYTLMDRWELRYANGTYYDSVEEFALNRLRFTITQLQSVQTWIIEGFAPIPYASIRGYAAEDPLIVTGKEINLRAYLTFPTSSEHWYLPIDPAWGQLFYVSYEGLIYNISLVNTTLIYFEGAANPTVTTAYLRFRWAPIVNVTEGFDDGNTYRITIYSLLPLDGMEIITDDTGLDDRRKVSMFPTNKTITLLTVLESRIYELINISLDTGETVIFIRFNKIGYVNGLTGLFIVITIIGVIGIALWYWRRKEGRRRKKGRGVLETIRSLGGELSEMLGLEGAGEAIKGAGKSIKKGAKKIGKSIKEAVT